jgi:signal transduction histidine kinase
VLPTKEETAIDAVTLLSRAITALKEKVRQLPESGRIPVGDIIEGLDAVSRCITRLLGGEGLKEATEELTRPVRDARLVQAIRREVLAEDLQPNQTAAFLDLSRAMETVLGSLVSEDPDDLGARLTEPDAFELLVEVAHDLRSPLTSILFLSETLRGGHSGEITDLQRSQLGLIYSAALGLVSVSSDIVDLARREQGLVTDDAEAYSIHDVLQSVEELVMPMAEEKHVDLLVASPHYDRSYGHPVALGRVMLNLTTNAIKFTDKGFVELGAKIHGRRRIEFFVRDTGRGIAPHLQSELFQAFKKRPAREGHFFSGSGVGLSIARRLVRAMGSELQFETAADWGTRFFFVLDVPPLG